MLVGLGPGSHEHLTARARAAIAEADTVIGYVTYIRLVAELLEGKEVIKKSMTEELDRAIEAFERARQGKQGGADLVRRRRRVRHGRADLRGAVPGRLDAGLRHRGRDHPRRLGAQHLRRAGRRAAHPRLLRHFAVRPADPWPTIARRLDAVAAADFVVALYNPKSGRRTRQIVEARRLFLRHRRPDTPVAIVKSAYRPKQRIEFTTLEKMTECDIGMLSTVLIGNSNTFVRHGLMVTPRGYANKYDVESGATHSGEQAGRSLSTGLTGWLASLRASGLGAAALAAEHRLPEDYIAALLAEPRPTEEAAA
jgi:precorrin-3B C17-methyltransferase